MARFFVQISVSADGFIEDADGQLDWFREDKTAEAYATETLRSIEQARIMNGLPKDVLAHTLTSPFSSGSV
jgi:hypothetical protein